MKGRVTDRRWAGGLVAATVILTVLAACTDDDDAPAAGVVTRGDVAESGVQLVGQTVTVTGVVNEPSGSHAMQIAGQGTFFDGEDVLVVGRSIPSLAAGARVEVAGVVRRFDLDELEREIGGDLAVEGDYDTAIVAGGVKLIEPSGTSEAPS